MLNFYPSNLIISLSRGQNLSIARSNSPVETFQTSLVSLMQMIEILDFHTKHPLVQTTPYIVVASQATL